MTKNKTWRDIKIGLQIFAVIFAVTFFIFNGEAFISLAQYKTVVFYKAIKNELTSPPRLAFWQNTDHLDNTIDLKYLDLLINQSSYQNIGQAQLSATSTPIATSTKPVAATLTTSPAITLPQKPKEALTQNIIQLPKVNITAPIWQVDKPDLSLIYKKLRQGVVLFPGSSEIGQGQSIIIGHSSAYPWEPGRYKSVFSLLSQFNKGDKINIFWKGKTYIFAVINKKIFLPWPKGGQITENIFTAPSQPSIILQSCWPVGVDQKRIAVQAILIKSD